MKQPRKAAKFQCTIPGISWHATHERWVARFSRGTHPARRTYYVGEFNDLTEAAEALRTHKQLIEGK
jgi:hypothetical protein